MLGARGGYHIKIRIYKQEHVHLRSYHLAQNHAFLVSYKLLAFSPTRVTTPVGFPLIMLLLFFIVEYIGMCAYAK